MRPSDENQHRSKRPNLFSTSQRPAGSDDHILAKLDRQAPAAVAGAAEPRTRRVWLGAAGVVVAGLIVTLVTLAQQNASRPRALESTAAAPAPAVVVAMASGNPASEQAALIVDEAPPPLVTLPSAAQPAPVAPVARTSPAVMVTPAVKLHAGSTPRVVPAVRPVAPGRAVAVTVPVIERNDTLARARATVSAALRKRPVAPVRTEVAVDTDVALLAAILAQSRQIAEREQMNAEHACSGAKCASKGSAQ